MHPEISRQIIATHTAELRKAAANRREAAPLERKHLRNPLRRATA